MKIKITQGDFVMESRAQWHNRSIFLILGLLQFGLIGDLAHGAATLYPKDPSGLKALKLPAGAEVLADHRVQNLFYVLPPAKAVATAAQFHTPNMNLGQCKELSVLQQASFINAETIKKLATEVRDLEPVRLEAIEEYYRALEHAESYKNSSQSAQALAALQEERDAAEVKLSTLQQDLQKCIQNCRELQRQVKSARLHLNDLNDSIKQAVRNGNEEVRRYERLVAQAEVKRRIMLSREQLANEKQELIIKNRNQIQNMIGSLASLEGGFATIRYESKWDELVNRLRAMNPGIAFSKADVYGVRLSAALIGRSMDQSYFESMPDILDYTVQGNYGKEGVLIGAYPDTLTANVRLSLAGACAVVFPELFQLKKNESGLVQFGLSAQYYFNSVMNTEIKCHFSQKDLYEKVMRGGSSGALWWKKSWRETSVTSIKEAGFNCAWDSDQVMQLDFAARRKFELFAMNFAMGKVLSQFATPEQIEQTWTPIPNSGLSDVANGLNDLCGMDDIYCRAGAWVLKSLDQIFAGGEGSSDARRRYESKSELLWTESLPLPMTRSTSYFH